MPLALCNAPATFERLMEMVLRGLTWKTCLVYLDDIMLMAKIFEQHLTNLEVFSRMKEANLKLNPKKCLLFQKEVEFLGHIVSANGITIPKRKSGRFAIGQDQEISTKSGVSWDCERFYYRRFVNEFADIAAPLHMLTDLKSQFNWIAECEAAFKIFKNALCCSPIRSYPQSSGMFILDTDASNIGIGAVLSQVQDKEEKVIEYFSSVLSKPEKNYCATRKELLAIVRAVEHFHKYLYGREFLIRTDHAALT